MNTDALKLQDPGGGSVTTDEMEVLQKGHPLLS